MNTCPRCESKGRAIDAATLEAQVPEKRLDQIRDHEGWSLCLSESCEVVYFRGEESIVMGGTLAVPFHKSDAPDRLVCFCFGHSVADVVADVKKHGKSEIREAIKAACKAEQDDCKRKNPQGRCCLGNIGLVIKEAGLATLIENEPSDECCGDSEKSESAGSCCEAKATDSSGLA